METTERYNDSALTSDMDRTSDMRTAVAAVFPDRDTAHEAVHQLHGDGFRDTWIGIARPEPDDAEYVDASSSRDDAVMRTPVDAVGAPWAAHGTAGRSDLTATRDDELALGGAAAETTRVESDNWFMRFFGEGDESLHDALIRHGVDEREARTAGSLPTHGAVVTVDGANHPELAAEILSQAGGRVITRGFGATGYGTEGRYASPMTGGRYGSPLSTSDRTNDLVGGDIPLSGSAFDGERPGSDRAFDGNEAVPEAAFARSGEPAVRATNPSQAVSAFGVDAAYDDATTYDDYGRYRAGTPVDESTRLQLREERLRVDKQRIARGEATVGTDVVTETHDMDVPFTREELFIERRPVQSSTSATTTPIGETEVVRIPLTEERVTISKVPFVTEEIVVGKRQVQDTEHVSETTRREQLNVADVATATRTPGDSLN
jgi:uncharacterized protein (TIGR02271 family)